MLFDVYMTVQGQVEGTRRVAVNYDAVDGDRAIRETRDQDPNEDGKFPERRIYTAYPSNTAVQLKTVLRLVAP